VEEEDDWCGWNDGRVELKKLDMFAMEIFIDVWLFQWIPMQKRAENQDG
jgi:hypothetical protein